MAAIEVDNKISQELKDQIKFIKQEINTLANPPIQNLTYYSSSSSLSTSDNDDSEDSESEPNNNNSAHESTEAVEESISIDNSDINSDNNNNTKEPIIYNPEPTEATKAEEVDMSIDNSNNYATIEPIVIHDDESIQIPCSSQYNNINTACSSQDFNINTSINKAQRISRGKYPMKRKLDSIIDGVQQNTKLQKQDNIEQTLKTIMAHIEKIDKRLDNLEIKSVITPNNTEDNTEDNTRNNTQKRDTPLQIKNSRNQVIVAFRDFWMPGMAKRFDYIEARLDSIEESSESIKQK